MKAPYLAWAAAAAATVSAQDDATLTITDPNHFDWDITHVPDLDQRRSGQPCEEGGLP